MGAAVQDVHHRDRQRVGVIRVQPADVAIERQVVRRRLGPDRGHRDTEQRVGTKPALGRGAVECDHGFVKRTLVEFVALERLCEFAIHVSHGLPDTFAAVARFVPVAQFQRLTFTRRGARWHGRPSESASGEGDIDFNCRIAARIQNLTAVHSSDFHGCPS